MPDKVLIYSRFPKAMMLRIGQRYDLMDAAGKPPNEMFSADQLAGVRAMITAGGTALGGDKMDMLPALQAIVCYGTGYDGVDLAAAASRKIVVGNSPAANAASVADIAMTLMLAVTRRLLPADNYVRSGNWSGAKPSPLMRPQPGNPGRRIGVYGMGEIGRRIAARAAAGTPPAVSRRAPQRSRWTWLITAAASATCRIDMLRTSKNWWNGAAC